MRIADMSWMDVEAHAQRDDRCVLPIGSVEQHAYLSLCVDMILAERIAIEAAEPLGVPVFPVLPYGMTPNFVDFPGSISLRLTTYIAVVNDILNGIYKSGFRRIAIVNGHGGNGPIQGFVAEWLDSHRDCRIKFHEWWKAPKTWAATMSVDPKASHASWMENFPWTRLAGATLPSTAKTGMDMGVFAMLDPAAKRKMLGDGNYLGVYEKPDSDMLAIWDVAVKETRDVLATNWPD